MKAGSLRGLLWMFLSTIGFSISHLIVRYVSPEIHSFQSVFFRSVFGFVVISPWLFRHGFSFLRTNQIRLHLLRSCISLTSLVCFYYALTVIPLAKATALGFVAPVLVTLFATIILKEPAKPLQWIAMLFGFIGMLIIIRPGIIALDFGTIIMLISTVIFSCNLLVIKILGRSDNSIVITSYVSILLIPLSLPFAVSVWMWPNIEQFLLLATMGIFNAISLILFTQAMKEAQTSVIIPLDFLRLIWMALLAYLIFGEVPDIFIWVGGAIIFAAAASIALVERDRNK